MPEKIDQILHHLYVGSLFSLSPKNIRSANIKLIIDCTLEGNGRSFPGVEKFQVPIDDNLTSNISAYFDICADKIEMTKQAGGSTLIHCMAGVSRSPTICIAYLMKYLGLRLRQAYDRVKTARCVVRPNEHFFEQLIEYEFRIFGTTTVSMVNTHYGRMPDVYEKGTFSFFPLYCRS